MTDKIEEVRGSQAMIRFNTTKCIHSRNCVLGRPDVFVPNVKGDWIYPDRASPEEIAALAANCPSGAITYGRFDGSANEQAPAVNAVRIRENGPLAFHAALIIDNEDGGYRATLCRCGASKNKPYCDSSHIAAGFKATGEPAVKDSEPLSARNGPLTITPQPDGPLKVEGPLEVVSGTGRTIFRTAKTFLCRCGGSQNKPFCDGSHKRGQFKSGS